MKVTPADIKRQVLVQSGLEQFQPQAKKRRKVRPKPQPLAVSKTATMKYLEQKYGVVIPDILTTGSLSTVVRLLGGEVDTSTISRWIKRFKLRYSADNLPDCQYCNHYKPTCDQGVCQVLLDLELYELVLMKKAEVLGCLNQQG